MEVDGSNGLGKVTLFHHIFFVIIMEAFSQFDRVDGGWRFLVGFCCEGKRWMGSESVPLVDHDTLIFCEDSQEQFTYLC